MFTQALARGESAAGYQRSINVCSGSDRHGTKSPRRVRLACSEGRHSIEPLMACLNRSPAAVGVSCRSPDPRTLPGHLTVDGRDENPDRKWLDQQQYNQRRKVSNGQMS